MGFNFSAGSTGVGTNPWSSIAAGINQGVEQRKENIEHQQDRALQQEQNQLVIENNRRQAAQAQIQQMTPFLLSNDVYRKDPRVNEALDKAFEQVGLPTPRNADGTLDLEGFKQPLPEQVLQQVMQLPVEARKPQLDALRQQYRGITPDMYTGEQAISAKEAAIIGNLQAKTKDLGIKENLAAEREKNRTVYQRAKMGLMGVQENELLARIGQVQSQIALNQARTADIPIRTAQAQQRLAIEKQRADQMLANGKINRAAWNQALASMKDIQSQYDRDRSQLDTLERLQAQYQATGVPDDDPKMTQLQTQIDAINAGLDNMKPSVDSINGYLQRNVNDMITGNIASQRSGKPTEVMQTPVGDASGIADGTTANGGKYIARGGKWYAQ